MNDRTVNINQVVRRNCDSKEYRVLWISDGAGPSYWIRLEKKGNIPETFSIEELEEHVRAGSFELAADHWCPRMADDSISLKWKKRRDQVWDIISDAVQTEPDIYDKGRRAEILRGIAKKSGLSFNNLYDYLGKYWKRGKVPNALLPDYGNVGKSRDAYKETSKKPGRPKKPGAPGKKLDRTDLQHFSDGVKKYFLSKGHDTFKDSYEFMIRDWYASKEEGKEPEIFPPDELPSFAQYRNWYYKNRDILGEIKERDGEGTYNLKNRAVTQKTETTVYGPGAVSQIDATLADIYLVSQADRSKIVGRPEMYFVMDAATHIVTGMHITLKPASWESAALALRNSAKDKVSYCARYGVHITEEEWPCRHLPQALVADRGEVESSRADVLADSLGIQIVNTPPYRGDLKGIIEQHFRLINLSLPNSTPGKVMPDFGKRGGRDYRLDAVLDIHQFTAIIIRCVLHYNNHHYMKEFTKTMQMRQLGVRPVPIELWNYGVRYQSGGLRTTNEAVVNYALLPNDAASITEKGICFRKMYYTCEEAENGNWFALARTNGRGKITVAYDPSDMDMLYIKPYPDKDPVECHLMEHNRLFKGLDETETATIMEADTAEAAAYTTEELNSSVKLKHFITETVKDAKKQKNNAPSGMGKTERLSRIGTNRQEEIAIESAWQTQKSLEARGRTAADMVSSSGQLEDPYESAVSGMIAAELEKVLKQEGKKDGT